jgi:hypothetical protein
VTDFGALPSEDHRGIVLLYDDTMPAYCVASALIAMVDAYQSRAEFLVEKNPTRGSDPTYSTRR